MSTTLTASRSTSTLSWSEMVQTQWLNAACKTIQPLTLCQPLALPLSLAHNALRSWSSLHTLIEQSFDHPETIFTLFKTVSAVMALVATVFAHPIGMLMMSAHDLIAKAWQTISYFQNGANAEGLKNIAEILGQIFYFTALLTAGFEMAVLSIAVHVLLGFYQLWNGTYAQGVEYTIEESFIQRAEIDQILHLSVGALGEQWNFPSDHTPVAAQIGNAHFFSWNVLNTHFLHWIDQQGLTGSLISKLNTPSLTNAAITKREELEIQCIEQMLQRYPRVIFALQECSPAFIQALRKVLPAHFQSILTDESCTIPDQVILLYPASFTLRKSTVVQDAYPSSPVNRRRAFLDVTLRDDQGVNYRIMNAHVPGDPALPARNEFAHYVLEHTTRDCVTIALGDMNFTHEEMELAFTQEAEKRSETSPFINLTRSYNTNIHPTTYTLKCIDHIWTNAQQFSLPYQTLAPNQIYDGLQQTVDLLSFPSARCSPFMQSWLNQRFKQERS